ncbi:hypothetical protein [Roseomonas sp. BN140053]|uniref:hypothetical protein n=1 Tax=Roseomonas sp. BN140053 TaxID=3391898 RepID=UPI0039EA1FE6
MDAPLEISVGSMDAVIDCLRRLAAMPDLGSDETFVGAVSRRVELSAGAALACRKILARHRDRLPEHMVAVALGESEPLAVEPASCEALDEMLEMLGHPALGASVPSVSKRGRGRPPKGDGAMSKAERNRRWREGRGIVSLEVPAAVAERVRQLRDGRTTAQLLLAALDALERAEGSRAT